MQTNCYFLFRGPVLLCGVLLFYFSVIHAQEQQQPLMAGTYRLNVHETPLYYIPHSVFRHYNDPVLHIQTVPFQALLEWGTQFAIVSRDTTGGALVNSIVFLNAQVDTSAKAGFVSRQTEPLYFQKMDSTMQLIPAYGMNPLERRQNGVFNLQGNWFSLYYPHLKTGSWKDILDENKSVSGTSLTIETAAFDLFRPTAFERIIYNNTTDSIPLYDRADTLTRPQAWFQAGENLFVHKDSLNGLWLKVSRFELVPFEWRRLTASGVQILHSSLEETIGWIRREDRYRGQWERHITEQPGFRFEVTGADLDIGDNYYTRGMLAAIKVIDKKSDQPVQIITDIGAEITDSLKRCLHFTDANFDGHPDIMADFADGGAGPNYSNIFYLFDPASRRFVYNETLSALSQVAVDTLHHVIRSAWRNGAGQHGAAEYRFINGKMEQTYQWDQIQGSGYFAEETESVRQPDGQWKESLTYGAEAVADTVAIYRRPDEKGAPIARLAGAKAYFKIRDEAPLWYYVQTDCPDSLKGWIRKETVFPDNWAPLSASFIPFTFEKVADDYGNLLALRITDPKTGTLLQIIGPIDNHYRSGIFEPGDYNRDGRMDFRIRLADEEAAPVVYLFDKRSRQFVKAGN